MFRLAVQIFGGLSRFEACWFYKNHGIQLYGMLALDLNTFISGLKCNSNQISEVVSQHGHALVFNCSLSNVKKVVGIFKYVC